MIAYRPVGLEELLLIYRSAMSRFPPRLPEQPIFYPVLSAEYAEEIARVWNAASGSLAGYVTEFEIDDAYADSLEPHQVGARAHLEFWIPAESLSEFNDCILGQIRLIDAHFGAAFVGVVPSSFSLRGRDARAQFEALRGIHDYSMMDFHGEVTANHEAVFAHFPFWERLVAEGAVPVPAGRAVLDGIRQAWSAAFPSVRLGLQPGILRSN